MTDAFKKKLAPPRLNIPLRLSFGRPGHASAESPGPSQPVRPSLASPSLAEAGWTPPLDLLRERRRELDLEPISGLLVQRPALLRRGLLIGGLLLGSGLGICGLLLLWHQMLTARMGQLVRYETDVEQLSKTLVGHRAALKKVRDSNDVLVKRLSDVRSSSALMADLQLRVPEGVQITSVQMMSPTDLRLEGVARDPVAFGRVNAMELVLRQSPLFAAKGVTVGKVERLPPRELDATVSGPVPPGGKPPKLELPSLVHFEMSAALTPLPGHRLVAVMEGLKAEGMTRRLELLQREGLLK